MISIMIVGLIVMLIPSLLKELEEQRRLNAVMDKNSVLADEYIYKKQYLKSRGFETEGAYIFTNTSKNNYRYVGQSINVMNRIDTHLKGRGNPDVYRDIMNGDVFAIELIKLSDTDFYDLNGLESYLIAKHNTYYNGYNKTRGNS